MQHVLVHIDQGLGPIGAWSYRQNRLTHFYPESLDPSISGRARLLMAQRQDDITIDEWMDLIADTEPNMLDEYTAFDIDDDVPLNVILAQFRRTWTAATD
jgi:hypothetical protein